MKRLLDIWVTFLLCLATLAGANLLIYRIDSRFFIPERTGTNADLFE